MSIFIFSKNTILENINNKQNMNKEIKITKS